MQIVESPGSVLNANQQYRARVTTVGSAWTFTERAPLSAPTMRRSNAMHVLDTMRRLGKATRVDLARETGLTMPTVHRVVTVLENLGLIHENEGFASPTGSGRRPTWYAFEPTLATAVGIDIGNETTRAALALADGSIVSSLAVPTAEIASNLIDALAHLANQLCHSVQSTAPLVGAGVGISGTVDPATGMLGRAAQHRQWDGMPVRDLLQAALGCPVVVEQDDHLAALAELSEQGGAQGASTVVVVNVGKGIGVGLIAEGRMLSGAHGAAGRLAHWPLQGYGPQSVVAGNTLVADALTDLYRQHGGARPVASALDLCNAAREGDTVAQEIVATVGETLGDIFLRLAAVFDPEIMVFGGGLANSFDLFAPAITRSLAALSNAAPVVPSRLGADAVVLGSLIAVGQYMSNWLEAQIPGEG